MSILHTRLLSFLLPSSLVYKKYDRKIATIKRKNGFLRFLGLSSHFGCQHCTNYHTKCRYCGQNEGSNKSLRLVVLEIWNLCTVAQYWVTPPALRGQKNFCPTMARRHCSFRHSIGSNESKNAQNRTVYIFTSLFENLLFGCLTI